MSTSRSGSRTWNIGGCWWLESSRMAKSNSGVVCSPSDTWHAHKNTHTHTSAKKLIALHVMQNVRSSCGHVDLTLFYGVSSNKKRKRGRRRWMLIEGRQQVALFLIYLWSRRSMTRADLRGNQTTVDIQVDKKNCHQVSPLIGSETQQFSKIVVKIFDINNCSVLKLQVEIHVKCSFWFLVCMTNGLDS